MVRMVKVQMQSRGQALGDCHCALHTQSMRRIVAPAEIVTIRDWTRRPGRAMMLASMASRHDVA